MRIAEQDKFINMKSLIGVLFVNLIFILCVNAQVINEAKRETDKDLRELVGSVHTVRIERQLVESFEGDEFGGGWIPSLTIYNPDGNIRESVEYNDKGDFDCKLVSKFDSFGNKVLKTYFGADNLIVRKFAMRYDAEGNQIEFKNINADETISLWTKFTYDKKRNLISHASLNSEGQVLSVTDLSYDKKGRLREETSRNAKGEFNHRTVYSYNEKDKSKEIAVFNAEGFLERRYVSSTDEKGNQTELSYNADGKITSKEIYEYKRDSNGNWITETVSEWEDKDGVLILARKKITKRTITYY